MRQILANVSGVDLQRSEPNFRKSLPFQCSQPPQNVKLGGFASKAPYTRVQWKRSPKMHLFKNALQSGDFWKRRLFAFICGRTKSEVFEYDDVTHHILLAWPMLRKGCYRIYIVLAFSCGRAKTIRIRYVRMRNFFENGEKILFFKNVRIPVDGSVVV